MKKFAGEERLKFIIEELDQLNKLTGKRWVIVHGNPHASCEWLLTTGEGAGKSVTLCESNMLGRLLDFLHGVRLGYEMRKAE